MVENEEIKKRSIGRYENIVSSICNVSDFDALDTKEWEGCLGVAMVLAYMKGVDPSLTNLTNHLNVGEFELENAFDRLRINGIFTSHIGVRKDKVLMGQQKRSNPWISKKHLTEVAWGVIAGYASGFVGVK
jgi:hypothetical protein